MAPTQRHRWITLPKNRQRGRQAALQEFAVTTALAEFEARYPELRMAPLVAVIAAYEEEHNIGDVLKAMPERIGDLPVATVVVVDGGSDGTARVALDAGVHTCILPVNLGHGVALRTGYRLALAHGARAVVTLDADGQNDPTEMETIVRPVLDGEADLVIASRRLGVDQTTDRFRRAGVSVYASVLNVITGKRLTDSSNGFRAFSVELLEDIVPHLAQSQYQTAEVVITAASRGWRIVERPTVWHPRASGESKKGGNLFFGLQYGRVIATTWFRTARGTARLSSARPR